MVMLETNLQMFASDGTDETSASEVKKEETTTPPVETATETTSNSDKSLEEQLQEMRITNAKLKKAQEKAASEAANFKKQLRARQSEDEIALQEKAEKEAERDELIKSLQRQNSLNELSKNFLSLGYTADEAEKASIAQYDGETDDLFKIQNDVQNRLLKQAQDKWLASRPDLNVGVGGEEPTITKAEFDNLTYSQIVEFKAKYPETYKKYMK